MRRYLALGLALLGVGSCSPTGNDGSGPTVAVATVTVAPALDTVYIGAVSQLAATTKDADGNVLAGRSITWSKTGTGANLSAAGLVTGTANGDVTVTATSEGITGNASVVVRPVPVVSVLLTPPTDTIYLGATATFTATPRDSIGGALTGRVTTWSSLDAAASVNNIGVVTPLSLGTARIVAYVEGKGDTSVVTVLPVPVASVVITPAADTLYPANTVQLAAVTRDSANGVLAGRVVTWSSLDAAASVNNVGFVTALSVGTARIVATSEGKADTSVITVLAVPVASVVLTPAGDTLPIGEVKQFVAATRDSVGGALAGRPVAWTSTDTLVVAVSAAGQVTARDTGVTSVIATSEGRSDTAIVLVTLRPVGSVLVTPASDTVQVGDSAQFAAAVLDTAGTPLTGRPVTWSSLDTTASVTASGQVHALAVGTARIVAAREGKADTALVTVTTIPVPPASLAGTWSGGGTSTGHGAFTILFQFQQTDSVLTGSWEDGNGGDVGSITGVVSGNTAVIHAAGTNGGPCTSDWTATLVGADSLSGTFQSSVGCSTSNDGSMATHRVAVTASVVITASIDTMIIGDSAQFSAVARDSGNTTLNDRGVRWTSNDTTIITADGSGRVHAIAVGAGWVVATGQGHTDSVKVSVVAPSGALPALTGTWLANAVSSLDGPAVVVPYLLQTDSTLSGTWYSPGPDHDWGSLDGSVHGDSVEIIFRNAGPGCDMVWTSHRVGADSLNGSFVFIGGSCLHPTNNGPISAHRDISTAQVVIVGAPDSLTLGDSLQFVAEARDSTNGVIAGRPVRWTSGDTAVVVIASGGLAHATGLGTTLLVAEGQGRADTVTVTVVPPSGPGSEFDIAVSPFRETGEASASDGTNVLVGYHQADASGPTSPSKVRFVLLDPTGTAIASVVQTGQTGNEPAVAFGGGGYFAVYARHDSSVADLTGLFINSSGVAVGSPFSIKVGARGCGLAYAGGTFGILYADANLPDSLTQIYFRRISTGGTIGPEVVVASAPATCNRTAGPLASDGSGFLAILDRPDGTAMRTRTISIADALGAMNTIATDAGGGLIFSEVTAISGGWAAVWNRFLTATNSQSQYAVLAGDGSGSSLGTVGETGGTDALVTALHPSGTGFALAWLERPADPMQSVARFRRFDSSGAPVGSAITIATTQGGKFPLPLTMETFGGSFLVVMNRYDLGSSIGDWDPETGDVRGVVVTP